MNRIKLAYYGDFVTIPVAIALLSVPLAKTGIAWFLTLTVAGTCFWTLAEYLLHRFAMHAFALGYRLHRPHHDHPASLELERSSLSTPIIAAAGGMILVLAFGFVDGGELLIGLMAGYLGFIIVHHAVHRWTLGPSSWFYRAKLRHVAHHASDDCNFGVTTSFWDVVFHTRR